MTRKSTPSPDAVVFGSIFRTLRRARGWTIRTCARRIGITPAHLGVLEAGYNMPSIELLIEFADTFNLEPSTIMRAFEEGRRVREHTPSGLVSSPIP